MPQLEALPAKPPPLAKDADGVFRVGGTRVRLETVLHAFNAGCAPQQILRKYPSLNLTDIYAVIAYYLWHRDEVDAYVRDRESLAEQVKKEIEQQFPSDGIRERLLARKRE